MSAAIRTRAPSNELTGTAEIMVSENTSDLEQAIAVIEELDRSGCLEQWRSAFGRPPPKYLSPQFMKRVLIWELRNRMLGALSRKTERQLRQIASGKALPAATKPGSHLVWEWNGRTYQVEVVDGGYVMDGRSWQSLSAIARHITGARWSGSDRTDRSATRVHDTDAG